MARARTNGEQRHHRTALLDDVCDKEKNFSKYGGEDKGGEEELVQITG